MRVKMEPIQFSNPLLEMLSLPKEFLVHEDNNVIRRPDVSLDSLSSEGSSSRANEDQLELLVRQLHGDDDVGLQLRALQALENLVASPDDFEIKAEVVHHTGALTGLLVLLANDNNPSFQVRSAKVLRHLAAGNSETKSAIVNHPGALDGLVLSLSKDTNPPLRQNAAWALSHLAASNDDTKFTIAQEFVLKALVTLLEDGDDPVLHSKVLSTWKTLEAGGSETKVRLFREVVEHDVKTLRTQCLLQEIPPAGDLFKGLGTFLLDLANDEEVERKLKEDRSNSTGSMDGGNHSDQDQHTRGTIDCKQTETYNQADDHKQTGGLKYGQKRNNGKQKCSQMDDGQKARAIVTGKNGDDAEQTRAMEQLDDDKDIGGFVYAKEWDADKHGKEWDAGQHPDKEWGAAKDCDTGKDWDYAKDWDAGKVWNAGKDWDAGKDSDAGKDWDAGNQSGNEGGDKQKDDSVGCCSFCSLFLSPKLVGWWSSWAPGRRDGVALPESAQFDDVSGSLGDRPVEVVLMSLSDDLMGKDPRHQRKVLKDLCNQTQTPLNGSSVSYIAQHPEGLMELVTLLSDQSLRGLAGVVLKNLATSHQQIMVLIVAHLISLTTHANFLQKGAVWGLGTLAASNDNIKAEILEHGALNSLLAILLAQVNHPTAVAYLERLLAAPRHQEGLESWRLAMTPMNHTLQTMAAVTLRNLATGDCQVKARICQFPEAIDRLVSVLTAGLDDREDDTPLDFDDLSDLEEPREEPCLGNGYGHVSWRDATRGEPDLSRTAKLTADVLPPDIEFSESMISQRVLPQHAALAIGYLAGGDGQTKAKLLEHQRILIGLALALTKGEDPVLQQNAAFALGNLAAGEGQAKAKILGQPGVLDGLVLALMKDGCHILQQNAAFALSNLADCNDGEKGKLVDFPGVLEGLLVSLTKNAHPALQKSSAKAIDLLAMGDKRTRSKIANHPGAIEALVLASFNVDNLGMRHHLKWAARSLASNADAETMARTNICNDLWKLYSQPGVSVVNSTFASPVPQSSDICESFQILMDGDMTARIVPLKEYENYVQFRYSSLPTPWNPDPYSRKHNFHFPRKVKLARSLHVLPSQEKLLLEALPNSISTGRNSPISQRQAIRSLCNAVVSPNLDPSQLICEKIVDHPGALDALGVVLIDDSNPHLQRTAVRTLTALSKGKRTTIQQLVDHPALLPGLVTCFVMGKSPALQESSLEAFYFLQSMLSEQHNSKHSETLSGLAMALAMEAHPRWQLRLYGILSRLAWNRANSVRFVDRLTSLLQPGNTISFQYLASSFVVQMARIGSAATVAKIVDLHPWVCESFLASLQSGSHSSERQCLCYFESPPDKRNHFKVLAAGVLHNMLAKGDNATRAKLANYPEVISVLVTALAEDRSSEVQELAAACFSCLAETDAETRAKLVQHPHVLGELIKQVSKSEVRVVRRTSALAIANLAEGTVQTKAKIGNYPEVLAGLVLSLSKDESPGLQAHAAQAFAFLAAGDVETSNKIMHQPGALEWLVRSLADDGNERLQSNSAFALRNLALAEELRKGLKETDGVVEGLQALLEKEGMKKETRMSIVEKKAPSPQKWVGAACALTLLDPVRGNGMHLHTADAYCGRGRANLVLGLFKEALDDLNTADRLQQLKEPHGDNLNLSRAIWRYRSGVKNKLGDFAGAIHDAELMHGE